jgi:hypothetical protein
MTALLNQNDDEELPDPFVDRTRYFKKLGEAAARARQRREQDDKDEEVRGGHTHIRRTAHIHIEGAHGHEGS